MNQKEKKKYLKELTKNVLNEMLLKVPAMPSDWNGHELRAYMARKFSEVYWQTMSYGRLRKFKNEMLIKNL